MLFVRCWNCVKVKAKCYLCPRQLCRNYVRLLLLWCIPAAGYLWRHEFVCVLSCVAVISMISGWLMRHMRVSTIVLLSLYYSHKNESFTFNISDWFVWGCYALYLRFRLIKLTVCWIDISDTVRSHAGISLTRFHCKINDLSQWVRVHIGEISSKWVLHLMDINVAVRELTLNAYHSHSAIIHAYANLSHTYCTSAAAWVIKWTIDSL